MVSRGNIEISSYRVYATKVEGIRVMTTKQRMSRAEAKANAKRIYTEKILPKYIGTHKGVSGSRGRRQWRLRDWGRSVRAQQKCAINIPMR